MTKKEAIKFLQQIYPNGGHCWLDEKRIEAINMAIDALKSTEVSDDLEEAITPDNWVEWRKSKSGGYKRQ